MKIFKFLSIGLLMAGMTLVISCNKDDDQKTEMVPLTHSFKFKLTFSPGDTVKTYSGITGFEKDNVIITYFQKDSGSGNKKWETLPGYYENTANILPTFSGVDGNMRIRTSKIDGSFGSPWSSPTTISFKSVIIKSTALSQHPDLDLSNYKAVKEAFDLED